MQLISKFNKGTRFLLCLIDIFSKCPWVVPLKDKRGSTTVNDFQKIFDNYSKKKKKIWVDKGGEFYNSSFKNWLKEWYRNLFNSQWRKICCCQNIY